MSVYSTETLSPRLSSATHSGGTLSTDRRTRSALASAWFPLFNWERVAEDEADRHEKGEALVLRSSSSVHLQGGGVWLYLGRRGGQRGCWWSAAVPSCQCHWHVWSCVWAPGFKRMQELSPGSERATSEEAHGMNAVSSGANWEEKN